MINVIAMITGGGFFLCHDKDDVVPSLTTKGGSESYIHVHAFLIFQLMCETVHEFYPCYLQVPSVLTEEPHFQSQTDV